MPNEQQKTRRWKLTSAYTILFFLIIVAAILTWVIPAGAYRTGADGNVIAGTYHRVAANRQGIWDVFMAPVIGMIGNQQTSGALEISLFILVIGGFMGVVNQTGALNDGIRAIVANSKGHEKRLIVVLTAIFALGGSTYGMGEETLAFFPILVPVMMGVGYDSLVAAGVILLGTRVGFLASTVNPFATGVASGILNISPGRGLGSRLLLLILVTVMAAVFLIRYADRIKKDPTKSLVYQQREADQQFFGSANAAAAPTPLTKVQKRVLWLFGLTFVVMIIGLVPWSSINSHWTFFADFSKWLAGIPYLGVVLGRDMTPLGDWYFNELTFLFLLMAIVIRFVAKMDESEFLTAFIAGTRDMLGVAMIVAVARGIQVVMNSGKITGTLLHWGEQSLAGMSPVAFITMSFVFFCLMSVLIPSSSGLAAATIGIMGSLAHLAHVDGEILVTAFQAASGFVSAFAPTSGILMGGLALARIPVTIYWKWVAKFLLLLFLVVAAYLAVLTLI